MIIHVTWSDFILPPILFVVLTILPMRANRVTR